MSITTLENRFTVSTKADSTHRYIPNKNAHVCSPKDIYQNNVAALFIIAKNCLSAYQL